MTDDEQEAADAAQMLRAHQQLYGALADFEGVTDGEQHDAHVTAYRDHQRTMKAKI